MLFRRKELPPITAEQLTRESIDTANLPRGVRPHPDVGFYLDTIHGKVDVVVGDWIIPEPDGEHFYPCSAAEFERRYEPVPEAPAKTLDNSNISGARANVPDIKVVGNGDAFQLLCKASSKQEGWMKSTKAMEVPRAGCLVQVTTQQRNPDGSYAVAEALTFVPGVFIAVDEVHGGRQLLKS